MGNGTELKISRELPVLIRALHQHISEVAGQDMGITLMVYNTEPGGHVNYVSNCKREDVKAAMEALLENWDAGMEDVPLHDKN